QSWSLMHPRNVLLEHFPAICAAPKTVTQTARSASPSWLVSKSEQTSPVLLPVQLTSSSCQRSESIELEVEHDGPGSQRPLTSFWPGTSSGPCMSLRHPARTEVAKRPKATVAATSDHIPSAPAVPRPEVVISSVLLLRVSPPRRDPLAAAVRASAVEQAR